VFLKVDVDPARVDVEVRAMAMAPYRLLSLLGEPSAASSAACAAGLDSECAWLLANAVLPPR
jgi:hypothetical protein